MLFIFRRVWAVYLKNRVAEIILSHSIGSGVIYHRSRKINLPNFIDPALQFYNRAIDLVRTIEDFWLNLGSRRTSRWHFSLSGEFDSFVTYDPAEEI